MLLTTPARKYHHPSSYLDARYLGSLLVMIRMLREIASDALYVFRHRGVASDQAVAAKRKAVAAKMLERVKQQTAEEERNLLKIREKALADLEILKKRAIDAGVEGVSLTPDDKHPSSTTPPSATEAPPINDAKAQPR